MLRKFWWRLALLLYWAIVVYFLRAASPVFVDGDGPMPSFFQGSLPQPTFGEYMRRQDYYDLLYSFPYYLAGLVLTLVGCGATPLVLRRLRTSPSHAFWNAVVVTLALLLLLAVASDAGSLLGIWSAPRMLVHRHYDLFTILTLSQMLLPACFLSGVVAVGRRWMAARHYGPFPDKLNR